MTGNRKDDHVRHAVEQHRLGAASNDFDSITFVHNALAGTDEHAITMDVELGGIRWPTPLYINAMTGGSERTGAINRELAIAAAETGLPIGSGSMSAFLRDRSLANTFRVLRSENPHGFVMANVNANATPEDAYRAVELIEADALQIHLNSVQEIVMPEGDRSFSAWPRNIERLVATSDVPVIVKEVGFGLTRHAVAQLRDSGVTVADLGGRGGTNFARIENNRRPGRDYAMLDAWGQSTAACLLDTGTVVGIDRIASGGVRSPLDIARALALGACAAGVAGPFMRILVDLGTAELIAVIRTWLDQLRRIMTILGVSTPAGLTDSDLLITGNLAEFCSLRDIDSAAYARRAQRRITGDHCDAAVRGDRR